MAQEEARVARPHWNPFLLLGGKEWEIPSNRLYAAYEQAEILESGLYGLGLSATDANVFDGITRESASRHLQRQDIPLLFERLPIYLLEVALSGKAVQRLAFGERVLFGPVDQLKPADDPSFDELQSTLERLKRRWFVIDLTEGSGGIHAELHRNLFVAPISIRLAAVDQPTPTIVDEIDALDPLAGEPDASASSIESALAGVNSPSSIDGVAVYDVGQGTAQGLLAHGEVPVYADFGRGVGSHRSTFPAALASFCFCFTAGPPIFLSHWDEDHWSSAGRDTRAYSRTWIAPRPPAGTTLGFHHRAHASAILASGTLLLWPAGQVSIPVGQLRILKCTGTSRNASALALEIKSPQGEPHDPVLLPADAGYGDLPALHAPNYDCIACPHHGGRSRSPVIPICPPSQSHARLAYSYGKGNSHNHSPAQDLERS